MGQSGDRPTIPHFLALLLSAVLSFPANSGCDRPAGTGPPGTSTAPPTAATSRPAVKRPTVISLSPAATDILVAMGADDHLVAVSNYDLGKRAVAGLPGAGDYLTVDWERVGALRPDVLVVQVPEAAAPQGFRQRVDALGVRPVYIHIDDLDDISASAAVVGGAIGEAGKAAAADRAMREKLAAVAKSVAGLPTVRTLVVTDEAGAGAAGTGTFLNDLLEIAGGTNAAAGEGAGYPGLDRERILALKPDAVLHLLPDKPPRAVEESKRYWASMPGVPAVRDHRVFFLTDPSVMHPGLGVGEVAEAFADRLHPGRVRAAPATSPTSRVSPSQTRGTSGRLDARSGRALPTVATRSAP